jgi:hypothetical protein
MNAIRESIKDVLEMLASKTEQTCYEQNVPIADVPSELVCMWFDDMYHPESWQHKEAFSAEEQKILSAFNAFYRARSKNLPNTLTAMHADIQWNEIVGEARRTLESIKW